MDKLEKKIFALMDKIYEWDELSKNNANNSHNLSTSEREDWLEDIRDLSQSYFWNKYRAEKTK